MANERSGVTKSRPKKVRDGADHLAKYLYENDLSYTKFGEKVGCTKAHVCGLVNRKSRPSLELASRMDDRTSGAIPQASWTVRAR